MNELLLTAMIMINYYVQPTEPPPHVAMTVSPEYVAALEDVGTEMPEEQTVLVVEPLVFRAHEAEYNTEISTVDKLW